MKFAKTLKNEAISEWETKYIDYRNLKKLLKKIKQRTKDESIILTVSAASSPENAPSQVQNSSQPHLPIPKTPSSTNISPIMMPSPQMQLQEKQGRLIPKRPETPKSMKALMLPDAILQSPSRDPTTFPIPESPRFVRNLLNKRKSLKDMGSTESSPSTMTLETYLNSATLEEREFFAALDQELKKVEEFYCSKEDEAIIQSRSISYQADLIRRNKKSKSNKSNKNDNDESVNSSSSSVPMINRIFHVNRLSFSGSEDTNQKFFRRPSYAASAIEDNEEVPVMQKHTVKKALMEHYRSMQLLKNYKILNYTGFAKILKKFDKVAGWHSSPLYFNEKLHTTRWGTSKKLDGLIKKCEAEFIQTFTEGNRQLGMKKLRLPDMKDHKFHGVSWRTGFYIGVGVVLLALAIHKIFAKPQFPSGSIQYAVFLQLYGALFIPILLTTLFTVNLYAWSEVNINYSFIFEFDYRHRLHYLEFLEFGSSYFLVFSIFVYLTFSDTLSPTASLYMPLVLIILILAITIMPLNLWYPNARVWFVRTMYRIITAPSTKVQFRDFFIADQLVSLSYTLSMLQIIGCYPPLTMSLASESDDDITSSFTCSISNSWLTPVLAMLPPFWRLLQCLRRYYDSKRVNPHLINGGKYLSGVINIWAAATWRVKGTTPALAFWVVFSIISTLYGYAWDILMDWGFLQPTTKHKYLRDRLFYSKRWFYYFAMISNFVFRCSWTLSMIPATALIRHKDLLAWSIALFEMLRRWQWNFIRMENEHATNCGMFRATLEIPIPKFEPPTDEDEDRRKRYEEGDDETGGESHGLISLTKLKKRKQSNLQPRATNLLKESYRYRDYDRNDNHDDDQDAMEHGYGKGPDMMNNNGATSISLEEGVDLGVSQNAGTMSKLRFDTTGAHDSEGPIEEIDPEKNSSSTSPIIAKSVLGTEKSDRRTSKDDSVQVVIDT